MNYMNCSFTYPHGSKCNWEDQARKIASGEIIIPNSEMLMLLEWMRDMNWPGAYIISNFLKGKGMLTLPFVREALSQRDDVWNYWMLNEFCDVFGKEYWVLLLDELVSVASKPDDEFACIEAMIIIIRFSLASDDYIMRMADKIRGRANISDCDRARLDYEISIMNIQE